MTTSCEDRPRRQDLIPSVPVGRSVAGRDRRKIDRGEGAADGRPQLEDLDPFAGGLRVFAGLRFVHAFADGGDEQAFGLAAAGAQIDDVVAGHRCR